MVMDSPNKNRVSTVSNHTVKSSQNHPTAGRRHLTPFDLASMKIKYIHYGLLYKKPIASSISNLLSSFSKTLDLFHPLSGRLVTTNHDDNTIFISLDFTNEGAEFIHASAPSVSIHDFTSDGPDISDFFSLIDLIGLDGIDHPLLAAQVTELADGLFIACAFNHAVADGASAWHFINTWSFYSRCTNNENALLVSLPDFELWFIDSCPLPIRLPINFTDRSGPVSDVSTYAVENRIFYFSAEHVASLKARASERVQVSTLQAVLAHAWKAITRARKLKPEDSTILIVIVGYRTRKLNPAVPEGYFGNIGNGVGIRETAKELKEESLGKTAMRVKKAISGRGEEEVYKWVRAWSENPVTHEGDPETGNVVLMGESNRFDIYGNDFGWGKPIGFRYGWPKRKVNSGFVKIVTGKEEGSVELDVALREGVMRALLEDEEFMAVVG
uniref:Acyltransferase 2 n=1 Tax=Allium cepa TaxID=4679 RepID=A0A2H5AHX1_ALLCE|nr:acyltransferase 2 [Allium cepa]